MILAIWILAVLTTICSAVVRCFKENTFISDLLCYLIVIFIAGLLALVFIYTTPIIFF